MAGETSLRDVADVIMGQSPPGSTYNESRDGLPFFQGVKDFTYRHPTVRVYCSEPSRVAKPGDILLSIRAPIGRINVADKECCIGRGLAIIRPKSPEDFRYLEFILRLEEPKWQAIEGGGSVFGNATRNDIESLLILWPDNSDKRKAIAHILGTLDDKIELNRKMKQTLEEIAQTLFKSWFVDFDPVRAKAEGRDLDLPQHIATIFPDSFEDSELGQIPRGWRAGSIYEIAEVIYGAPFASSKFNTNEDGLPLIRIRDLQNEQPGVWTPEVNPKAYLVQPGDIVVGMDGEFRSYLWGGSPAWLNQRVCVFAPKPNYSASFVRNSIIKPLAMVEATESGTTVIHIGKNDIDTFSLIIPTAGILDRYNNLSQPLYNRIVANKQQSRLLSSLRDILLPKLISGELRMEEADRIAQRFS